MLSALSPAFRRISVSRVTISRGNGPACMDDTALVQIVQRSEHTPGDGSDHIWTETLGSIRQAYEIKH